MKSSNKCVVMLKGTSKTKVIGKAKKHKPHKGCSRGEASPDAVTKLQLFSDSGGYCQNPNCLDRLFEIIGAKKIHFAEMAHIISAGDEGPRSKKSVPLAKRGEYENLILLCPKCHTRIDKAESEFPEALVFEWKKSHTEKINSALKVERYPDRTTVRKHLDDLLIANKLIFEKYGPNAENSMKIEGEAHNLWLRNVSRVILPNNRKILNILDQNKDHLTDDEIRTLELFRMHVRDFEAKHLFSATESGEPFPKDLAKILKDDC